MRGQARRAALALLAGLAASCAGGPDPGAAVSDAPPPVTAPVEGAPAAAGTAGTAGTTGTGAGTSLRTAETAVLAKAAEERKLVEAALVFGSPESIGRAFSLIATATALRQEDARTLAWVGARVGILVYEEQAAELVPADLRGQVAIPQAPIARIVAEVLSGRAAEPVAELAGQDLAELLPALAVFRSDSRDTARRALAALERFEKLGSASVLPSLVRGLDAERRLAWKEALDHYASVLALAPDAGPALAGSLRSLLALKRPVEALALLQDRPELPSFRKPRAQALYDAGRLAEAEPVLAELLREDPLDARLMLMRAHLLVRARSFQQALPLLDAYGTVDPSNRLFLLLRALAAEGLRNRDEALKWARRALSAYPDDPEIGVAAGRILLQAPASVAGGQEAAREEGRALARRAVELAAAPASVTGNGFSPLQATLRAQAGAEASLLLLQDAVQRYDWAEAASRLEAARTVPGFDDRALVALVLRKSGNWAAALDQATAWYAEKPEAEAAAEAYARALVGTRNERAAQDLIPRLLAGRASAVLRSRLYYLQSLLQKSEEASLAALRSALVEDADNVEALAAFFDAYYRRRDFVKARFYLKQALALAPGDPELQRRGRELDAAAP